jgi:hypothetical protein
MEVMICKHVFVAAGYMPHAYQEVLKGIQALYRKGMMKGRSSRVGEIMGRSLMRRRSRGM